jgi:iron-sulfur cluster repair protein YtfE (RIC family)
MDVMDVLDHLEEEHRKVEQLLDQLAESDPGAERKQLVGKLEEALNVHMVVEEQFLYPVVLDVLGEEAATEAEVEHDLAREGITRLHALADQPGFGAAVDMVKAGIGHHVEEEESEMFPELRQNAAAQLAAMDAAQLEATVRSSGAASTGSVMTRDELYEQAKEAGVPGRSEMSKDELATALAQQR